MVDGKKIPEILNKAAQEVLNIDMDDHSDEFRAYFNVLLCIHAVLNYDPIDLIETLNFRPEDIRPYKFYKTELFKTTKELDKTKVAHDKLAEAGKELIIHLSELSGELRSKKAEISVLQADKVLLEEKIKELKKELKDKWNLDTLNTR